MKKFLSELEYIATVDNSHEEDNEVVERYADPVADRFFYYAGLVCIVAILVLQCI